MTDLDAGQRFTLCLEHVLEREGGYADHPSDPGGATNLGITRKTLAAWRKISPWWALPKSEVQGLRRAEAADIYRALYWERCRAGELPAGLDLAVFDFAVNSGPARAVKALQAALKVKADGFAGPITLDAVRLRVASEGAAGLIVALCGGRLGFLQRLATWATFGRGWSRRVEIIRKAALAMAGETAPIPHQRRQEMDVLSGYKTYIIAGFMLLAGLAQVAGIDIPALDGQSAGQLFMEGLAIVFLRRGIKGDVARA
jgi:lysozyme family protein